MRPICLGANFTSVTDVLLSTSVVLLTQWLCPRSLSFDSPTISSQTAAVRSKEQEAKTCPNSGWAHVTRHTDPLCVFQLAVQCHSPLSLLSQTRLTDANYRDGHVAAEGGEKTRASPQTRQRGPRRRGPAVRTWRERVQSDGRPRSSEGQHPRS